MEKKLNHPPINFGKTGVLIINLGTPDSTSWFDIRKYLDIFKDHPYIFNLGHGVLPETNPEMMEYLVKTVKDY